MQTTTRLFSLCLLILGFYSCQPAPEKKQPVDWVDPQIGSVHGRWFFYTYVKVSYDRSIVSYPAV